MMFHEFSINFEFRRSRNVPRKREGKFPAPPALRDGADINFKPLSASLRWFAASSLHYRFVPFIRIATRLWTSGDVRRGSQRHISAKRFRLRVGIPWHEMSSFECDISDPRAGMSIARATVARLRGVGD